MVTVPFGALSSTIPPWPSTWPSPPESPRPLGLLPSEEISETSAPRGPGLIMRPQTRQLAPMTMSLVTRRITPALSLLLSGMVPTLAGVDHREGLDRLDPAVGGDRCRRRDYSVRRWREPLRRRFAPRTPLGAQFPAVSHLLSGLGGRLPLLWPVLGVAPPGIINATQAHRISTRTIGSALRNELHEDVRVSQAFATNLDKKEEGVHGTSSRDQRVLRWCRERHAHLKKR